MKAPRPGTVKTRLARDLGVEAATAAYRCFAADTMALVSGLEGVAPYIAYTPDDAEAEIRTLAGSLLQREPGLAPWRFLAQGGEDLGQRMTAAVGKVRAWGHTRVVLVGSDSPHLPPARIREAVESLGQADLVLGPTVDGGYYLLATGRPLGNLLQGLTWSTAEVLAQTCQRARDARWSTLLLAEDYDVDTGADLHRLYEDLRAWDEALGTRPCPRTWEWLQQWQA